MISASRPPTQKNEVLLMSQYLSARLIPLVSIVVMLAGIAGAQVPTGSINGIVTDPKDAIVIGARVDAVSTTQGV
jgi:hypothetical protein